MPHNKLRSEIWNYFIKISKKEAVCTICNKNLKTSGNTTNLRNHLKSVHSQQFYGCEISNEKIKKSRNISSRSNNVELFNHLSSPVKIEVITLSQNSAASIPASMDDDPHSKIASQPLNRLRSKIWNYFIKISKKEAVCTICNKKVKTSGNTTNVRSHLKSVHLQQFYGCEIPNKKTNKISNFASKLNNVEFSNFLNNLNSVKSIALPQYSLANTPATSTMAVHRKNEASQPNSDDSANNIKSITKQDGEKSKKITEALANFLIVGNKPFCTVEGKGFLQLLKEICPLYKVPSQETIKSRIDAKYETLCNIFKAYLKNAENYCITYDTWTETMQNKSFISVTIHFFEKNKLLSGTVGVFELPESHTSAYITEKLYDIFFEWKISTDKVSAVTADHGGTVMKVSRNIFGEKKVIPCFAYTINLLVIKSIDNVKHWRELLDKVRDILKFIETSFNASDELWKKQMKRELKERNIQKINLDERTRWNSCFYMLQQFIELVPIVGATLPTGAGASPTISSNEIDCVKEMVQLLSPFEKLTKEISRDSYVTASQVIPLVSCVQEVIENIRPKNEMILEFKKELQRHLAEWFDDIEHCAIFAISSTLDPRFKLMHFKNVAAKLEIINHLNEHLRECDSLPTAISDTSDESNEDNAELDIWKYHKQLTRSNIENNLSANLNATGTSEIFSETEIQMYLSSPVIPLKKDAIEIWEDMKSMYPKLAKIAMVYLPIVAVSVPKERLFSETRATMPQDRNEPLRTGCSKLIFLNSVSKFLHLS